MQKNINTFLTGFIILVCFILVYFLLFTDFKRQEIDGTKRTVFIVILLVYAGFRSFRLYKQLTPPKENDEQDI